MALLQVLKSTNGSFTVCKVSGIIALLILEVDPQPDKITLPVCSEPCFGRLIIFTALFRVKGFFSFIRAMS